jgi:hypothetical protein
MKVLAKDINPNGIKNKNTAKLFKPYWYQKIWIPHYRYPNCIEKKDNTRPTLEITQTNTKNLAV